LPTEEKLTKTGARLQLNSRCGQQVRRRLTFLHFLAVLRAPFTLLFMRHYIPANLEVCALKL
jgi:hypothetical protein